MNDKDLVTFEELSEALYETNGIIKASIDYILIKFRKVISRDNFSSLVKKYNMQEYRKDCMINGVESALSLRLVHALKNGDANALTWYLNRYGHHADYLSPIDMNRTEGAKGSIEMFLESQENEGVKSEAKDESERI